MSSSSVTSTDDHKDPAIAAHFESSTSHAKASDDLQGEGLRSHIKVESPSTPEIQQLPSDAPENESEDDILIGLSALTIEDVVADNDREGDDHHPHIKVEGRRSSSTGSVSSDTSTDEKKDRVATPTESTTSEVARTDDLDSAAPYSNAHTMSEAKKFKRLMDLSGTMKSAASQMWWCAMESESLIKDPRIDRDVRTKQKTEKQVIQENRVIVEKITDQMVNVLPYLLRAIITVSPSTKNKIDDLASKVAATKLEDEPSPLLRYPR